MKNSGVCPTCGLQTTRPTCERCGSCVDTQEEQPEVYTGPRCGCGAHLFDGICGWCTHGRRKETNDARSNTDTKVPTLGTKGKDSRKLRKKK